MNLSQSLYNVDQDHQRKRKRGFFDFRISKREKERLLWVEEKSFLDISKKNFVFLPENFSFPPEGTKMLQVCSLLNTTQVI